MNLKMLSAALLLSLVLTSAGQAQLKVENEVGLSRVLSHGGVIEELELTENQQDRLHGMWIEVQQELSTEFRKFQDNYSDRLSPEALAELKEQLRLNIELVREREFKRLSDTLEPEQMDRLKQIRVQLLKRDSNGMAAIAYELELTEKQVGQISKLGQKWQAEVRKAMNPERGSQLTQVEISERVKVAKEQAQQELLELLTAEQRTKLAELEGEPYEFHTSENKAERMARKAEEEGKSVEATDTESDSSAETNPESKPKK